MSCNLGCMIEFIPKISTQMREKYYWLDKAIPMFTGITLATILILDEVIDTSLCASISSASTLQ